MLLANQAVEVYAQAEVVFKLANLAEDVHAEVVIVVLLPNKTAEVCACSGNRLWW